MKNVLFLLITTLTFQLKAQAPKRELRGAWIATVSNIDWPTVGANMATQQQQMRTILDKHKQAGLNAVYFQIRTQCDALYNSTFEPWSNVLSTAQGTNPGYDPLQFTIDECKKRSLELHAWINPYRAVINSNTLNTFSPNHIAVTRPDLLLSQGTLRILDPGKTEVWDYVNKIVMDVVRRYDIDGIHFDDYFYPYPPTAPTLPFDDNATFTASPRGISNIGDWRRANVDSLIKRTNDSIHATKPWVKFGVSPFGIWRNSSSDAAGSQTSGLQSYSDIYANSRKWIQNNWVDYLAPQLYWSIGLSVANYGVLIPWWNNNANARHIYSGMAAYKVNNGGTDANWNNPSQIPNQIRLNRQHTNVLGGIFYNTVSLNANPLGMRDSLINDLWKRPALMPNMNWLDMIAPAPPTNVTASAVTNNSATVQWQTPPITTNELQKARRFVIYRFVNGAVDINNGDAIRAILPADSLTYVDPNIPVGNITYAVTTLDRLHNESTVASSNTVANGTTNINTVITELNSLKLFNLGHSYTLHFGLTKPSKVSYNVLNQYGAKIASADLGKLSIGTHNIPNLLYGYQKGTYIIQLIVNGQVKSIQTIKL